ncbi:hypothetical protein DL98DRAFT_554099 [Cadophora sp. DSE1049]|nr:hypothetical protein DL98DRAFT_554099 [Cadophora sp. DSE1049]
MVGLVSISSALAQKMSYGADNWYRSNNVTVHPINFQTQFRTSIAGSFFLPNSLVNGSAGSPAIVVGHPIGAVKDQSANLYATKLAEQGFGTPMNTVLPDFYAEAFSAAADYSIYKNRSFVISASKIDARIKAIATSRMYDMGSVFRNGLRQAQSVERRKEVIAGASQQRWVEVEGGDIEYMGGTPDVLTTETDVVGRELFDFYRTNRGLFTPATTTPLLTTHPTLSSHVKFMKLYPFNDIETISPRSMLVISGDRAHSSEFSKNAFARAVEPKELVWVAGAGNVDLYDRVELIPFPKFTEFFKDNLASHGGNASQSEDECSTPQI